MRKHCAAGRAILRPSPPCTNHSFVECTMQHLPCLDPSPYLCLYRFLYVYLPHPTSAHPRACTCTRTCAIPVPAKRLFCYQKILAQYFLCWHRTWYIANRRAFCFQFLLRDTVLNAMGTVQKKLLEWVQYQGRWRVQCFPTWCEIFVVMAKEIQQMPKEKTPKKKKTNQ